MDLGESDHLSILDTPFNLFCSNYLDVGQAYLVVINDKEALLKVKIRDSIVGITQMVALLDVTLNLNEEDLSDPFFSSFQVGETTFCTLTVEAITAIKAYQQVRLFFNNPNFTAGMMNCQQIIFHRANEEPNYGEAYAQKCRNLQI